MHLSTIDDHFDDQRDFALGPHCFLGREDVFPEWQDHLFIEAFPDEASLEIAEKNVRGLVNHLLPGLVDRLNTYHGTAYSIDFWRLIILPWLIELSQRSWVIYTKINNIRAQAGDRPLTVPICRDNPEWDFADTGIFFDALQKDYRFNWWMDSCLAGAGAPTCWSLIPSDRASNPPPQKVSKNPTPELSRFRSLVREIKYRLGYTDILGIRWSGLLLAVYVNLLPKSPSRLRYEPDLGFNPENHFPRSFLDVLSQLIDATMPKSFLEGFPSLAAKARRLPYKPGRLRLGALNFWNEQEKVIAAFAKEAGEKRVVFQHGGEYGMIKYNMIVNEMEGRLCTFITWGWSHDTPTGDNILPLPSPFHSKIANRHRRQNDSIIVVGQAIRIHLNRIHWVCRSRTPLKYCRDTVSFLESLTEKVRNDVIFRPYVRVDNDIEISEVLDKKFPGMPMLEGDLHEAIMKCRLVVLFTFSTTMNLTMAANVPTVVYVAPELMTPRKEARPYFEALKRCGVVHETPGDAADHINEIGDDIEGWWHSPEVQNARKQWAEHFAKTDKLWWWQWMKALARLKETG